MSRSVVSVSTMDLFSANAARWFLEQRRFPDAIRTAIESTDAVALERVIRAIRPMHILVADGSATLRAILREVLGFSAREAAEVLETTTASVNSALQRARAAVEKRLPEQSQQETLRALGDEEIRQIVDSYVDAWERRDVEAVVSMLDELNVS